MHTRTILESTGSCNDNIYSIIFQQGGRLLVFSYNRFLNMEIVVLDFETTGLYPNRHRVIEVSAVIIQDSNIVDTFTTLINPGLHVKIPAFITKLTGISRDMLFDQPDSATAMKQLHNFIGDRWILAHNASFDQSFYVQEMSRIGTAVSNPFLCSLLLSRRLLQKAPSHKLSALKYYLNYKADKSHTDHRAYSDVLVTIHLWNRLRWEAQQLAGIESLSHEQYHQISKTPKARVTELLQSWGSPPCDTPTDTSSGNSAVEKKATVTMVRNKTKTCGENIKRYMTHIAVSEKSATADGVKYDDDDVLDDKSALLSSSGQFSLRSVRFEKSNEAPINERSPISIASNVLCAAPEVADRSIDESCFDYFRYENSCSERADVDNTSINKNKALLYFHKHDATTAIAFSAAHHHHRNHQEGDIQETEGEEVLITAEEEGKGDIPSPKRRRRISRTRMDRSSRRGSRVRGHSRALSSSERQSTASSPVVAQEFAWLQQHHTTFNVNADNIPVIDLVSADNSPAVMSVRAQRRRRSKNSRRSSHGSYSVDDSLEAPPIESQSTADATSDNDNSRKRICLERKSLSDVAIKSRPDLNKVEMEEDKEPFSPPQISKQKSEIVKNEGTAKENHALLSNDINSANIDNGIITSKSASTGNIQYFSLFNRVSKHASDSNASESLTLMTAKVKARQKPTSKSRIKQQTPSTVFQRRNKTSQP